MADLAVYVHIPYCRRICPYCDFNVHPWRGAAETEDVTALGAELDAHAAEGAWPAARVTSVFFGGGTPSLFAPASVGAILDRIGRAFTLAGNVEVTLEANPGTVDIVRLRAFRTAGVTRLSLGVQSFDTRVLRRLGRDHDGGEARRALDAARTAGFENVSVDLIYGVPEQTPDDVAADLDTAVAHAPAHVSTYELTWEPRTPFHRARAAGRLAPPADDAIAAMEALVLGQLGAAGYLRYEISSHARPGFACRHNQAYWTGQSYLGLGPGAHSFVAEPLPGRRWANVRDPAAYRRRALAGAPAHDAEEALSIDRARADFVVTGLRRLAGVDGAAFRRRFGIPLREAFPVLADLAARGLVEPTADGVRLTPLGLRFADTVGAALV